MFVEQTIELELRSPGTPGGTYNPKPGYFYDKTKISKANIRVNCYLLQKIMQKAMYLASLHLDKVKYKMLRENELHAPSKLFL